MPSGKPNLCRSGAVLEDAYRKIVFAAFSCFLFLTVVCFPFMFSQAALSDAKWEKEHQLEETLKVDHSH